ncbi:MAG TPA: Asd/ArgC dimerization domain-containing protein [Acidobacteriaceae bacterium]|jgi:aspartate-semialdehyde dehydrogenase|nr:Asd/ArgC dimerization domain-containing protein [Acidobacteriaceae bacterium]
MTEPYRIAIVGAASLRGKELNEALTESAFAGSDFLLLDDQQALGRLETVGDEVSFIQGITPDSFDRVDFTFFAEDAAVTQLHWQNALRAGSSIVDLSYALEGEAGVLVRAPWIDEDTPVSAAPGLQTPAIVSAHPAALALALLLGRVQAAGAIDHVSATVLEPASEYGRAAMDELHQQTVALLSFQSLPKSVYDIQVAFNAIVAAGESAKVNLAETEERIRRHYALLAGGRLPRTSLQLVHLPVFHGHCFSIAVHFERPVALEHVEAALSGAHVEIVSGDPDAPSNLSSAGQEEILVRVRSQIASGAPSRTFWLWASTDNLKLAVRNAVECAQEMRGLRPRGVVQ